MFRRKHPREQWPKENTVENNVQKKTLQRTMSKRKNYKEQCPQERFTENNF